MSKSFKCKLPFQYLNYDLYDLSDFTDFLVFIDKSITLILNLI